MVLLLVALVEDVAHGLFFLDVVVVLEHAHLVELHLPEKGLFLPRVPRLLGLRLAGHLLVQGQLRVVEAEPQRHLVGGNGADVLLLRANAGDFFVELVGLDGDDFLQDLREGGVTVCSCALQMALICWRGRVGSAWSARSRPRASEASSESG